MRRIGRIGPIIAGLLALAPSGASAQREAVPLNDYARLGQRFTETRPFTTLWISVPSWLDNEGGLRLTLWDSTARQRAIGRRTFEGVRDNAMVELPFRTPVPAGTYYWEVDARTGSTRVGLYADPIGAETDDCAYLDGKPRRDLRFVFGTSPTALQDPGVARLRQTLRSGSPDEKREACRILAVYGDSRAAPDLAPLLRDPELSHMARFALEAIPGAAASSALRAALKETTGDALVGVIHSIGARRDAGAVRALAALTTGQARDAASAAAYALGRIATPEAAAALRRALGRSSGALPIGVYEGCLNCADALTEAGRLADSRPLYDALKSSGAPEPIRLGAALGAIVSRGRAGTDLLLRQLRANDLGEFRIGLWVAQRQLPGAEVTRAVVGLLPELPVERQAVVIEGLGLRRDRTAVAAIAREALAGDKGVRLAAVGALVRLGGPEAVASLVALTTDADAEIARAAQDGMSAMPGEDIAASASLLLENRDPRSRIAGIAIVARRRSPGLTPMLLRAARDADAGVRDAAVKALGAQGGAEALPGLLDLLASPVAPPDAEAIETAIAAVCARTGAPAASEQMAQRLGGAAPSVKAALVRLLGDMGTARALQAVRGAVGDPDAGVRSAAVEALQAWPTADAAPDLLRLAREMPDPSHRLRCLRGLLRIAGAADMQAGDRLKLCREAAPLVERDEEKKMLLGALGSTGLPDALALVVPHLDHAAIRSEACAAVLAIAETISGRPLPSAVAQAVEKVVAVSDDPDVVRRARAILPRTP